MTIKNGLGWFKDFDNRGYPKNKFYQRRMFKSIGMIRESIYSRFSVLDVGCGPGIYAVYVANVFPNSEVFGFDINKAYIRKAIGFSKESGIRNTKFMIADATDFDMNMKFDYIICSEVLEHVPNMKGMLDSIHFHGHDKSKFIFSFPSTNNTVDHTSEFDDSNPIKMIEESGFCIIKKNRQVLNFKNRYANSIYSKILNHRLDDWINMITNYIFSSNMVIMCKKTRGKGEV